jgi:hypothetical protein
MVHPGSVSHSILIDLGEKCRPPIFNYNYELCSLLNYELCPKQISGDE